MEKKQTTNHILLVTCLVLMAGCDGEDSFSRYPSVPVPEYETEDYLRDLSGPDPEQVYNAVCNLGMRASAYGSTLSAKDADPASEKYQTADEVYQSVCGQLESKNPLAVAAGLRFLQLFSKGYKAKEELLELAMMVENSHPLVQFEQVTLLKSLVTENSRLPEPLLRRLLDSPSWIVSRITCDLIGKLQNEPLRPELVRRYRSTEDERDRLLLINALRYRLEPEEARLLEGEMLATESIRIRRAVGRVLAQNAKCPGVQQWFLGNYPQFSAEEKARMFDACGDVDLACQFIAQGYTPNDKELQDFLEGLDAAKNTGAQAELLRFDEALLAAPQVTSRWQDMKAKAEQERHRMDALQTKVEPIVDEFREQVTKLLADLEMPASSGKAAWALIFESLEGDLPK